VSLSFRIGNNLGTMVCAWPSPLCIHVDLQREHVDLHNGHMILRNGLVDNRSWHLPL
jgi:hypothetical protein